MYLKIFSNSGLSLHWGDTHPKRAKNEKMKMKIDLRVLSTMNTKQPDLSVGEFAKKAIPSKLYNDKLKEVLISKFHLNHLLLSGLPQTTTVIPLIQIMGFSCQIYVLKYLKGFYVLQNIHNISFPTTHQALKENGIMNLISSIETVKVRKNK
ncbi:hypothetical protein INT45_012349 [Circinella minor]|uniref:Uncharacterized protein n=1 Tax=Circinella minor TaxID=1195481 RepID=A0A8H7RZY3_9FUNG|nr:hypothetical protein INT45_012349 [Circinella minor]